MYPHIRALWAPSTLYEAHNPRQIVPLDLYEPEEPAGNAAEERSRRRELRRKREAQAQYGARRDLMNVLRGKSTRMAWDYQAEASTISDDEREYEAKVRSMHRRAPSMQLILVIIRWTRIEATAGIG